VIAHVAFVDCTPEQAEEAARRIAAETSPVARQREGFISSVLLVDRAREQVLMVTLWESEEARAATDVAWPKDQPGVFEQIGVRRREARIFEVLLRTARLD